MGDIGGNLYSRLHRSAGAHQTEPVVVILIAVYALARHRPWWQLWPAAAAVELTLAAAWWQGELPRADLVALTAILAATVLLGMTVRTRRAYIAELEARARRLERNRDQQAKLAAAAERTRIAREMHDIVAHNLAVMVAATGRQALGEMQRLVGVLRDGGQAQEGPLGLTPQPGLDDLDELVEQVRAAGMRVTLIRQGAPGGRDPGAGLAVYRIVQEALTNTLKHAGPQATAQVRLRYTATGVDLEVTDDAAQQPNRPPHGPPASGHGLAGMIERATAHGGNVEAGPLPDAGWRVHARLQFNNSEAIT